MSWSCYWAKSKSGFHNEAGFQLLAGGGKKMPDILLEMNNITKSFPGVQVLKNVQFSVRKGSISALVGKWRRPIDFY
jgi:ATPase subunit of ABC transporter with duplicated ATPase domains